MPASPDRALRRLVADLAAATTRDVEAVLSGLDPRQRRAVEALIASYRGEVIEIAPPERVAVEQISIEGLSPWLTARLDRRSGTANARPGTFGEISGPEARVAGLTYTMTETAFAALRESAESMQRARAPSPQRVERGLERFGRRGRTIFDRRVNA